MKNHYVDNKALYASLCEWKEEMKTAPEDVHVPVPNFVAESILKISENLSRRYNFSGYTATWKEEMIGDAIEHCLRYIKNFDTEKYKNPHAYITRICFNAFVQRIKKERQDTAIKYKVFLCDSSNYSMDGEEADYEFLQQMLERVNSYETSKKDKAQPDEKNEPLNLQKFYN
ncbi:sigma factor for late transcription [Vibrio phage nt-1]|uniref:RNA polymerase sigma-like factor n=1 Tax=Vibrio phage nt-1 TaxID=115992 RepID=R9TG99_9CAUD|nr:late sigma transcription factor [Vibrio phage nt-1]AGN30113.1 sigma factor for late transcription [Vibrio phage nt-1]